MSGKGRESNRKLTMACDRILASVPKESFIMPDPPRFLPYYEQRTYPSILSPQRTNQRIKNRGRPNKSLGPSFVSSSLSFPVLLFLLSTSIRSVDFEMLRRAGRF